MSDATSSPAPAEGDSPSIDVVICAYTEDRWTDLVNAVTSVGKQSSPAQRIILVVVFDDRSSLGLVRLRVKKAGAELARIFEEIHKKAEQAEAHGGSTPFAEITDEDIDNLFS